MHRQKLSPRGKLYLKTDAEGKLINNIKIVSVLQFAQHFFTMIFNFHVFSQQKLFCFRLLVQIYYQFSLRALCFSFRLSPQVTAEFEHVFLASMFCTKFSFLQSFKSLFTYYLEWNCFSCCEFIHQIMKLL